MRKNHLIILVCIGIILSVITGKYFLYAFMAEVNDEEIYLHEVHEMQVKKQKERDAAEKIVKIDINDLSTEEKKKIVKQKILRIKDKHKKQQEIQNRNMELQQIAKDKIKSKFSSISYEENSMVELMGAPELSEYPIDLDISDFMRYKTIQERALSCELSATADILSHLKNKKVAEKFVISLVAKSEFNKLPVEEDGKLMWGDPNAGYVGYIDKLPSGEVAKQTKFTGYGVLEGPINEIYKKFGYDTKIITSTAYSNDYNKWDHLRELLENLNKGNMVQMWGDFCTDQRYEDSGRVNKCLYFSQDRTMVWYFRKNGNLIRYEGLKGEHAFYLLGYIGGVKNPSHIIVWDTMTGKHTYQLQEWMRKWDMMQNRSIIINKKKN